MTDRTEPTIDLDNNDLGDALGGFISATGGLVSDVISGVPAPVKKSLIKAISQLCTAAMDVPIAHFEGLAAEKRAESKARVALIGESGQKIASELSVNEAFVNAASYKFAKKIVREQVNLNSIVDVAVSELKNDQNIQPESGTQSTGTDEPAEISDDWLNNFEREASTKSSLEMQRLFGKILAGEIKKPSSFSARTVRLIGQLDTDTALAFSKFCSIAVSIVVNGGVYDARVVILGADKTMNPLREFGVPYQSLLLLQESGLLMTELGTSMDYSPSVLEINKINGTFNYLNEKTVLIKTGSSNFAGSLLLSGPSLTSSGRELLSIVDLIPNQRYTNGLREYFSKKGLTMMGVKKA